MMHELNGRNIIELALSPDVNGLVRAAKAHVARCQECQKALTDFVDEHILADAPVQREPLWAWSDPQTLLIQLTQEVVAAFRPAPKPAWTLRGKSNSDAVVEIIYHYTLLDEQKGFGVDIEVEEGDTSETCAIIVTVTESQNQEHQELTGVSVKLGWDGEQSQVEKTDIAGEVFFEEIPKQALNTLFLEITP